MAKRKSSAARSARKPEAENSVRLQKFLAQAGHGSRRHCEELMREGRVSVDGKPATKLGFCIDPNRQKVEVDGSLVRPVRSQYFMVNKPPGVVSTSADPAGRMRVIDLINTDQRVYNVGRLDKSSEGLILVTNDGDLANRLTHPRYGVQKTYLVTVAGNPGWEDLQLLKKGVRLAEGVARVTEIRVKKRRRQDCDLLIVLDEGRNREIRRLLARIGHKVTRLKRTAIGPLNLADLPAGSWRRLEAAEIKALKRASAHSQKLKPATSKPIEQNELERQQRTKTRKVASRSKGTAGQSTPSKRRSAAKSTRSGRPTKPATAGRSGSKTKRKKPVKKRSDARASKTPRTPRKRGRR